jgi:hypothetical protein
MPEWLPRLRPQIEEALAAAGTVALFERSASTVTAASGETLPWTVPLHREEAESLVNIVRSAAIIVLLAVTGMRVSEVMELQVGSRQPPQEGGPGMARHRIASNVVKGQPLGGTRDEWVVIEPVYQAVGLAEQLHDDPGDGALLFGRFHFGSRYRKFRDWVNGSAGQRLGLAPIPGDLVTPRKLMRTLAIELAYRPGGLLAAKLHLKHISVVIFSSSVCRSCDLRHCVADTVVGVMAEAGSGVLWRAGLLPDRFLRCDGWRVTTVAASVLRD